MADTRPDDVAPSAGAVDLCAASALAEAGTAHGFDLLEYGRPVRGFVLRFEGRAIGYLNRCAHVPTEMDWREGEFLDQSRQWIICSIHGAMYDPRSGQCVSGPCTGRSLKPLALRELDGRVYWYPENDLAAPPPAAHPPA
ncbi:MAG: Rieske (2Fe-2S) protein [Leptothrix sp. (in: b-proteobacteria)]